MKKLLLISSCLALSLAAVESRAASIYWDINGTTSGAGGGTTPSGTWESANWSTSSAGTATTENWPEGNDAFFAAGTNTATGAYTVTANANHTVTAIFDISGANSQVAIKGSGQLAFSGAIGCECRGGSGAGLFLDIPLADGATPGILVNEGSGSLYLFATNTFSGGLQFGASTGVNFNNNGAFGTGPISYFTAFGTTIGVLAAMEGAGTNINITNAYNPVAASELILVGATNPIPLTFSGQWTLPAGTEELLYQGPQGSTAVQVFDLNSYVTDGGLGAVFNVHATAQVALLGSNDYTGGTTLSGTGIVYYNTNSTLTGNCQSFGTGTVTVSASGGAIVAINNSAITIANAVLLPTGSWNIVPGSGGTTFTGGWTSSSSGAGSTVGTGSGAGSNVFVASTIGGGPFSANNNGNLVLLVANNFQGQFSNSCPVIISNNGDLGDAFGAGNFAFNVINNSSILYCSAIPQTFYNPISGTGSLIMSNAGNTLTLNAVNTYTGVTVVSAGTIAMGSGSSINNSAVLSIGPGGTFDASGEGATYTVPANTTLSASGTGSTQGTTAADFNTASGATLTVSGPISLTYTPDSSSGTIDNPALYIPQATLALSGNTVSVNNASGTPLNVGTYRLIQVVDGSTGTITGTTSPFVAVTGAGIAAGMEAFIQVTASDVNLVVQAVPHSPVWDGNDFVNHANWSDGLNWQGNVAPDLFGDNVTFAGSQGLAPVMDNSYTNLSLTFDATAGSFVLTASGGNTMAVGNPGVADNSVHPQAIAMTVQLANLGLGGASQWSVANSAGSLTASGIISDLGQGLTQTGSGKLVMAAANTYTGPTTLSGGTLQVDAAETPGTSGPLGDSAANHPNSVIFNGGTLQYSTANANDYSGRFGTSAGAPYSIDVNAQSVTLATALTGTSALTLQDSTGGGTLALSAAETYTGGTSIGASSTLAVTGGGKIPTAQVITNGGLLNYDSTASETISGSIEGSGALAVNGTGILTLSGANTYAGNTTINAGALILSGAGLLGNGSYAGAIADASHLGLGSSALQTISGIISGSGTVTNNGSGTNVFSGANTYTGNTTISAGTVQLASAENAGTSGPLGAQSASAAGTILMTGGTLQYTSANAGDYSGRFSTAAGESYKIDVNGQHVTYATALISPNAPLTLADSAGGGILTLSAPATYSNTTTINAGTLRLGVDNGISTGSAVTLAFGATIDLNGHNQTLPSLISALGATLPAGNIINNNGTLTLVGTNTLNSAPGGVSAYSGVISGSGNLVIAGGTTILSGANLYGGTTTINAGTLVPSFFGALPSTAAIAVNGAGLFDLVNQNETIGSLSGTGTVNLESGTLTVGNGGTFAGVIENSSLPYTNVASGNGLQGFYFTNLFQTNLLTALKVIRTDANVNVTDITQAGQNPLSPQTTDLCIRWMGQLLTTATAGSYIFQTSSDDGSRLWVNGQLVVNNWNYQGATARSNSITLSANTKYDIRVEYVQGTSGGSCVLSWTPPGGTTAVIPTANLFTYPGAGGLTKSGNNTLTLTGTNTYTGPTAISAGTLALGTTGSINDSGSLSIAAGATLDVSAYSPSYALSAATTLTASGAGTAVGSTAAAISGNASGSVNLGAQPITLNYTPSSAHGDSAHPALYISQGVLSLNGNALTIDNEFGTPLGTGTYTLIQQASGNIASAVSNTFTVIGSGLAAGTTAAIQTTGGTLNLVVTGSAIPSSPVITLITSSSGNVTLSGTNGPDNGTFHVLSATNVATPLSRWTSVTGGSFGPTGNFNVTTAITNSPQYFIIVIP